MARKSDRDLEKITIRLFLGDKEKLQSFAPSLGYNGVIRHLVSKFIRTMEEQAARDINKIEEKLDAGDIQIDID